MFPESAVGDAYGVGFEYAHPQFVLENNDLAQYYIKEKFNAND
jgi:hypothetical protein